MINKYTITIEIERPKDNPIGGIIRLSMNPQPTGDDTGLGKSAKTLFRRLQTYLGKVEETANTKKNN